ncbi:MAG: FliA/WhiG family RNA polymerase sigma factor [Planctomycetes bacterium]|nr:FliA/WhiG family RNA polymerase sigma factor [Planctomycetota bacterium]
MATRKTQKAPRPAPAPKAPASPEARKRAATKAESEAPPKVRAAQAAPAAKPAAPPPPPVVDPQRAAEQEAQSTDELWRAYKATKDENLRNLLVEKYYAMVRHIAERVLQTLPKSIDIEELCSAGVTGLMDAINGFDLSRGIKFKTYCTTRIRGSILDELRSQDWVPRLVRLKAHRLERASRQLEGQLGRTPNQFELAQAMGISLEELQATESEANARAMFSLSEKWDDGDDDKDMEKVEILADQKCEDPMQTIHQRDLFEVMTRSLTKKERLILVMYYYEGLTMREIGEILELTESRVCQIHSNVMSRLKVQLDRAQLQVT